MCFLIVQNVGKGQHNKNSLLVSSRWWRVRWPHSLALWIAICFFPTMSKSQFYGSSSFCLPDEHPAGCSRHCSLPAAAGSLPKSLPASLPAGAGISQASLATQHNLSAPYPPKSACVKHLPFDHKFTRWTSKPLVWSKPARVIPP